MSQVESQKRAWEDYNNHVQAAVQEVQQNPEAAQQYDPKAVEWASKNSWFGTDNIMTSAALMIDNELKEEGYDPSDDEFYVKVEYTIVKPGIVFDETQTDTWVELDSSNVLMSNIKSKFNTSSFRRDVSISDDFSSPKFNTYLVKKANGRVSELGLDGRVKIVQRDLFEVDLRFADVVTLYLTTSANERVRPKLESELRHGTRIVSHDYEVLGWKPLKIDNFCENPRLGYPSHTIYVYHR